MNTIFTGLVFFVMLAIPAAFVFIIIYAFSKGIKQNMGAIQANIDTGIITGTQSNHQTGQLPTSHNTFDYVDLTVRIPQGQNEPDVLEYMSIFAVTIDNTNTHIIVDSQLVESGQGNPFAMFKDNKYEAEGDFAKYFDLYIPEGNSAQALSLLSPEVLQRIKQYFSNADIEIRSNKLFVYIYKVLTPTEMQSVIKTVDGLVNDMKLAQASPATVGTAAAAPIQHVAPAMELKTKPTYSLMASAGIVIIGVVVANRLGLHLSFFNMCFIVAIFGTIAKMIHKARVGQLRKQYDAENQPNTPASTHKTT